MKITFSQRSLPSFAIHAFVLDYLQELQEELLLNSGSQIPLQYGRLLQEFEVFFTCTFHLQKNRVPQNEH